MIHALNVADRGLAGKLLPPTTRAPVPLHWTGNPATGGFGMAMYDDKKIANLVKKMTKQAKPKSEVGKVYDKTAPQRVTNDGELERDKFFKEMKKREF